MKNKIIFIAGAVFSFVLLILSQIQAVMEAVEKLDIVNRIERITESFNEFGKLIDRNYTSITSTNLWESSKISNTTRVYAEIPANTVVRVIREVKGHPVYLVEYKNIRGYVPSENFIPQPEKEKLEKEKLEKEKLEKEKLEKEKLEKEKLEKEKLEKEKLNAAMSTSLSGDKNPYWVTSEDIESYFWFPKGAKIQARNNTVMTQYDAPRDNANVLSAIATPDFSLDIISRWGGDGKWYSVHWSNNKLSYVKISEVVEIWPLKTPDEQDREYIPNSTDFSGPGKFIALKEDSQNPSMYRYYIALSACPYDVCDYGVLRTEIKFFSSNVQRRFHQVYSKEWGNYYVPMVISLPKKYQNIAEINMYIQKCTKISKKCEEIKIFPSAN